MTKDEDSLLAEFSKLVLQCRKNVAGDCPSRDDVLVIFASEYINSLKKLISEKDYKLDIAETRIAQLTGSKYIGEINE